RDSAPPARCGQRCMAATPSRCTTAAPARSVPCTAPHPRASPVRSLLCRPALQRRRLPCASRCASLSSARRLIPRHRGAELLKHAWQRRCGRQCSRSTITKAGDTRVKSIRLFAIIVVGLLAATARAEVTLVHVHGLSYGGDGKRLMIPSHFGLAIYENGKWSKAPGPEHDYMGFSATASHLYSSG